MNKNLTLYYNANIITINDDMPFANAVLVGNGKIISVDNNQMLRHYNHEGIQKINMNGKTILPAFIDSHSHISYLNKYFDFGIANGVDSLSKLLEKANEYVQIWKHNGIERKWFVGSGYDNTVFNITANDLDSISTEFPIVIIQSNNHAAVLNHKALEILGHTEIEHNGLLKEDDFYKLYYNPNILQNHCITNTEDDVTILKKSMNTYASYGIATAQEGAGSNIIETVKKIDGKLLIDINAYDSIENVQKYGVSYDYDKKGFRIAGVKIFLDGSPQAKTAWLNQPYKIPPENKSTDYCGNSKISDKELFEIFVKCIENKYQIIAHANGSAAIEQFIVQYGKARTYTKSNDTIRPVIIHAQTITQEQIKRAKNLNINISFFHDHVYYWADYHIASVLGNERGMRISPLKEAVECGINTTIHQDSPVIPPNMLFSIHNAVNRISKNGTAIGQQYAVDVLTAIKMVTINGAYQYFQEDIKGSIQSGKNADFVVLDNNPLSVDKQNIKDIKVLETIKDGVTIYKYN